METKFTVAPTSIKGYSLIQWELDNHGLPSRSIQAETGIVTLWAAAPDLLAALADLLAVSTGADKSCGHLYSCTCPYNQARAAIARAKGEV